MRNYFYFGLVVQEQKSFYICILSRTLTGILFSGVKHSGYFGSGYYEEHFYDTVLNYNQWFIAGDVTLIYMYSSLDL